jgi:3-oxoacyl-[acyl-carrier-protein] synthase II
MSASRRVVITGMGLVSPLGNDKTKFWSSLYSGQSGIRPLTLVPTGSLPISSGGEATEFTGHITEFGKLEGRQKKAIRKGLKVMCREIQMGVAASQLAFQDAKLPFDSIDRERTGVVFGSDYIMTMPDEFEEGIRNCLTEPETFQFEQWAEQGLPKVTPLWLLKYLPNMPACHVAIYNDLRGPNNSITVREASSNLAMAEAFCTIERGHADAILSGATGTRVHPIKTVHVAIQEELASENGDPTTICRPFDAGRSGMVVGEGAAALMLEEKACAEKRGAEILAEIVGFGSSAVIGKDSVARRDVAIANSMRQALRVAGITPDEIGHVNAHGLSTVKCDREEAKAIVDVFGERSKPVPVVAAKSYFGNVGAGGGCLELIASVQAMAHGTLFPTLNYESPDPDCPLSVVKSDDVPSGASVMNISVTHQGQASALIVKAPSP